MKNNKTAVSLIVLVITILVLSILATIVIISLSNTNIIGQTSSTVFKQDLANYKEAYEMYVTNKLSENANFDRSTLNITYENEEYEKIFGNVPDKYKEGLKVINGKLVYETEDETEKAVVKDLNMKVVIGKEIEIVDGVERSKYIGYFADIDGDGTVDGVIFADLAHSASGKWYNDSGAFLYEAVSGLKNYEIIEESYTVEDAAGYGSKPVLKATGSGKDRFYVMSLSNFTTSDYTTFYWYNTLIGSADIARTANTFGNGKQNTVNMISDWTSDTDGQNSRDLWGVIQDKVEDGWFVPSRAEWAAFGYAFGLTSSTRGKFGLSDHYWSSSLHTTRYAWYANYFSGFLYDAKLTSDTICVRLATTF